MSFFHKELTKIFSSLEKGTKPVSIAGAIKAHRDMVKKEYKIAEEIEELLREYDRHLGIAEDLCRKKEGSWNKRAEEHVHSAHSLILQIIRETKKLYGDEHRFLK